MRNVHDQAHIVLDQKNGETVRIQLANERTNAERGGMGNAGRGLVEQEKPRRGGERARNLQKLAIAKAQVCGQLAGTIGQTKPRQERDGTLANVGFFRARAAVWPESRRARTHIEQALTYAGAGSPPNDFFGHKFGYDFETLKLVLTDAGFQRIRRSDYMKSAHRELRVDHASGPARAVHRGVRYSLFVEASRRGAKG